ncbi:MAG TPA: undecaprenyldiphospho-muramoylpentapeptide beta-N-acetylglucosaminyltransferase [Treponema sp.]|nr:MAG: undecaprenyldiphospho-muramoylpentapeptide beta-N-acetylglucosaminyltransferase [Treponema sp. GWC1_61_84]OHE65169.1 MAG: undecaprenyldiphospho-muramoylpentapeptide beta-N-acetylglucosaminyltransferase [Treponema sp. GWA1_62_8]OHE74638.1 MAG: undecaprenyldiphospho-muramoylpentapeptide beta-N-acetylglucosaminyltransferase [Treponema sp. RIFOXYC1_FULL_61_9]HCM27975.1 undecaprenyldiphospho-muramoylpentapeptide beta-N-acetylglucosaminyltransferase [Treponema sp.]
MIVIAFTGGGTGGHIYPGLAIAERLRLRIECRIVWIGSDSGMDRSIVEGAGLEFIGVPSGKLRRYLSFRNILDLFKIAGGFLASRKALKKLRPRLLFSKGGFVSVPPCAAAAALGIPVFTHESDFSTGLATRLNLRWAERLFVAYPDTRDSLSPAVRAKTSVIGNPVRAAFRLADAGRGRRFLGAVRGERILLVLGGSQGAREVNELVAAALPLLRAEFMVVHQTGAGQEIAAAADGRYKPFPYIRDELPDILAAADLVVGRSGAGTVWEAATAGKPMVLVPLRGRGTRGDQVENAEQFRKAGAAIVYDGEGPDAAAFADTVIALARDEGRLSSMAAASKAAGFADAADLAASAIIERINGGNA